MLEISQDTFLLMEQSDGLLTIHEQWKTWPV